MRVEGLGVGGWGWGGGGENGVYLRGTAAVLHHLAPPFTKDQRTTRRRVPV